MFDPYDIDIARLEAAQLDRKMTMAYATDKGGRTSHTAILARSQGVPAVVGLEDLFDAVETGDAIIIDGNTGSVVVNPTESTIEDYRDVLVVLLAELGLWAAGVADPWVVEKGDPLAVA